MPCARQPLRCWFAVVAVALAVFSVWPQLDLAVTRLFWTDGVFLLARVAWLNTLRTTLWDASLALLALSAALAAWTFWRGAVAGVGPRVWGFVVLLYLLGPGVLVNLILKANWGRARPANIADFGGSAQFTPVWQVTDQCQSNCSFVSGEGAAAVALAISAFVILAALRPPLPGSLRQALQMGAILAAMAGLLQRLVTGRHFLSDTVFAALFVIGIALVLRRLLLRPTE